MLKTHMEWCKDKQIVPGEIEQYIKLPLVMANSDGTPYKGNKSQALGYWKKNQPQCIITNSINHVKDLDCIILEGMFLINTTPSHSCHNFGIYAKYLFQRWIQPHFRQRAEAVKEVHVVFDCQERDPNYIKVWEQQRRDQATSADSFTTQIVDSTAMPPGWHVFLKNRNNKKSFVNYLCAKFIELGTLELKLNEKLVVSGGFKTKGVAMFATVGVSGEAEEQQ